MVEDEVLLANATVLMLIFDGIFDLALHRVFCFANRQSIVMWVLLRGWYVRMVCEEV